MDVEKALQQEKERSEHAQRLSRRQVRGNSIRVFPVFLSRRVYLSRHPATRDRKRMHHHLLGGYI